MNEVKVYVNAGLIGDALCTMPFLRDLSENNKVIAGPNINKWVLEGIDFPLYFDPDLKQETCKYFLDSSYSWTHGHKHGTHMAEGHYALNGLVAPKLPYSIPVKFSPTNLQPGIVVAPYSRSDIDGNKFWLFENWRKLVEHFSGPIYVVGSTTRTWHNEVEYSDDDIGWIEGTGIIPIFDRPMSFVSQLLVESKLVVTIDTGIAHLAHLLGIKTHAYLFPEVPGWPFADNPNAQKVKGWPCNITVDQMLACCKKIEGWY